MLEKVSYKDVIRYTWYYWRQHKKFWPYLLGGMALAAVLDTLFPVLAGRLIAAINETDLSQPGALTPVLIVFAWFIALEVSYHAARNGTIFMWNLVAVRTLYQITADGFAKVQKFSSNWHANNFAGATVRKITRGMWSFDTYGDILFMYLFPTTIIMISTVVIMTMHWPVIGLITFLAIALYVGVSLWTVMVINAPGFKKSAGKDTAMGAAIADAVTANSVVKSHGTEDEEEKRFQAVAMDWRRTAFRSWTIANGTDTLRRFISIIMMAAMMGASIWLWSIGKAEPADVVYVFTAYIVLSAYLRHIGEQVANMQRAISEMEDAIYYWKTDIAVKDRPDAGVLQTRKGEIVFDKVRFAYGKTVEPIYDDFSLTIRAGEKVALVGHSGSGKSTFVKLVQRLYDIQDGEIRIDGQNIAEVTQGSLRKAIALVPQEPILFHRTLAENIAYGKPGASQDEIIEAAKQAYAHDFIGGLEKGYDTMVGERGVKLSGGERQRVAIARAILADAPILILDEATSSLDSVSEHYIQKALENLMKGRTSITIAHRLSTIKSVDRILVFDQGRIVEQGTHEELVGRETSHYKTLYEMQALDLVG